MDRIGCIVLSFEEAPDLGALAPWKQADAPAVYSELRTRIPGLEGFVFLSTCNRVEIIYSLADASRHTHLALDLMELMPRLAPGVRPAFLHGKAALRHLLRLAAGLESMVLGETEIRAQLKDALENHAIALDKRLRLLFQQVFREARNIRNSIPLDGLPLSVATLATRKLAERLGLERAGRVAQLTGVQRRNGAEAKAARVAIIGSGPMSQQSARYLGKLGCEIVLVNRNLEKVQDLAENLGAQLLSFDSFLETPEIAGPLCGVVTATSRADAFLDERFVERALSAPSRTERPLVFIDMALPRDVHPNVEAHPRAEVVHMESMRLELELNREKRSEAAKRADALIDEVVFRLDAEWIAQLSAPVMGQLQKEVRDLSRGRLNDLLEGRLRHLSARDRRMLYDWAIRANRDLNRLHRRGLEDILRYYYAGASGN